MFICLLFTFTFADSSKVLSAVDLQMQAAWATQQLMAAACATPTSWGSCTSATWVNGACAYVIDVDCTPPPDCDAKFAEIFVPPLEPNDPCVIASGFNTTTKTCTLQLDARCQAKVYHERFNNVGGTYYGFTVSPASSGAVHNLCFEALALVLVVTLATVLCLGCAPVDGGD